MKKRKSVALVNGIKCSVHPDMRSGFVTMRKVNFMHWHHSIKKLMKNEMLDINFRMEIMEHSSCVEAWDHLKRTCMYLFKPRHHGVRMKIKVLTKDEIKVVAQMADEMVGIWNKYIRQEYGNGDTNANG